MLRSLLSYSRGAGIDVRWVVIEGTPDFFRTTKRIHNFLHGAEGDGGGLGDLEAESYRAVSQANSEQLAATVRPEDIVLLHDPQTAGLAGPLKQTGARVVWRSHIGVEVANERVALAWDFLQPFLESADACVFSRRAYVPDWANAVRTEIIQPSIDVFSAKNQEMSTETAHAILGSTGLLADGRQSNALPAFKRQDGSPGRVDRPCEVTSDGPLPDADTPLIVQVSRWDRLKDPEGVMDGFARHVLEQTDAHLMLAGPAVRAVADDPEGAQVLEETRTAWRHLPVSSRNRIHLVCIPMDDIEENAAIVNALQRQATIVVQKSLQEGFGLTVAEAMWKSRPVVASSVGGIKEQIEDGTTGLLLEDPRDLAAFGELLLRLLDDPELAAMLGANARERVRRQFLATRHAIQYINLFQEILRR